MRSTIFREARYPHMEAPSNFSIFFDQIKQVNEKSEAKTIHTGIQFLLDTSYRTNLELGRLFYYQKEQAKWKDLPEAEGCETWEAFIEKTYDTSLLFVHI